MDEGNGLTYIRARYYMPELGRFITKDPLTGNEGDGQSLNRYVYGVNNPVINSDINGLFTVYSGVGEDASLYAILGGGGFVGSGVALDVNAFLKQTYIGMKILYNEKMLNTNYEMPQNETKYILENPLYQEFIIGSLKRGVGVGGGINGQVFLGFSGKSLNEMEGIDYNFGISAALFYKAGVNLGNDSVELSIGGGAKGEMEVFESAQCFVKSMSIKKVQQVCGKNPVKSLKNRLRHQHR